MGASKGEDMVARSGLGWAALLIGAGLLVISCETEQNSTLTNTAAGASTTSAMGGSGGMTSINNCSPPCEAGQFCSASGKCIDDGTCAHDDDCAEGTECDLDSGICVPGGECGDQEIAITPVPSNVMFVVDRSCSLSNAQFGMVEAAITKVTTAHKGKANYGLILFPDKTGKGCDQDDVQIPIAPGMETMIQQLMQITKPNGPCVTNISQALAKAAEEPAFSKDEPGFIVFFTDGKQSSSCGGNNEDPVTIQILTDLLAKKGVPTYVIGFGKGVDAGDLNDFAMAGGKPLADPMTKYYLTEDQNTLDAAFAAIVADTLSCEYELANPPPEGEDIYVFFNDDPMPIPQDPNHEKGWDYDPMTNKLTFYGVDCAAITDGTVVDIDIVYGCPEPTPT